MRLPDIHIIGAGKSGSSSLYEYLAQHPEIYSPGIKEPRTLLCLDGMPKNAPLEIFVTSFEQYLELWKPAGDRKALEGSVVYMPFYKIVIPNIKKLYAEPEKICFLAILRNPVDRTISHYKAQIVREVEYLSFEDACDPVIISKRMEEGEPIDFNYIYPSLYYEQIKAYIDVFPRVKVLILDDMKANPRTFMDDVCDFLELDRFTFSFDRHNVTRGIPRSNVIQIIAGSKDIISSKFPIMGKIPLSIREAPFRVLDRLNRKQVKIKPETRGKLKFLFREDILKLQDLISRDLSAWLK